jgi:hypothetical protein
MVAAITAANVFPVEGVCIMFERDLLVGLFIVALASAAGYYFYLARLHNAQSSAYKNQIKDALRRYWVLESAAQSVIQASTDPHGTLFMIREINSMAEIIRKQEQE